MGKALIIKGADFSADSVKKIAQFRWMFGFTDEQLSSYSEILTSSIHFAPSSDYDSYFLNKTILGVKLYAHSSGHIYITKFNKANGSVEILVSKDIVQGINDIYFDAEVLCGTDYIIGFRAENIVGKTSDGWSFRSNTNVSAKSTPGFCIDFMIKS